ncbi:MAG: TetR/AcrR family transcriptional regulator [Candidatus Kapabacteria bacterium]|nr:TetR/AcrR family transcriptional regulator [Candidatus Kapabacteria bacterium]
MGISERKLREKESRKNNILDSAEKLFFSKGYRDTTMDDIASSAELSKGTLYLYFKSKDEVYFGIALRAIVKLSSMFRVAFISSNFGFIKLNEIGRAHYKFMMEYSDYHKVLSSLSSIDIDLTIASDILMQIGINNDLIAKTMTDSILIGMQDGSIRPDINAEKLCYLLQAESNGVFDMIQQVKCLPKEYQKFDPEELFTTFLESAFYYMKNPNFNYEEIGLKLN